MTESMPLEAESRAGFRSADLDGETAPCRADGSSSCLAPPLNPTRLCCWTPSAHPATPRGPGRKSATRNPAGTIGGLSLPNMDVAIKETLGDLSQDQALELCRRLWREPVW